MEFRQGILVDHELEIAYYFRHAFSMDRIVEKTGMNRKILQGHVRNMREKLHAEDTAALIRIIQCLSGEEASQLNTGLKSSTHSKIRESTNTYFDSIDTKATVVGRQNVILIAIALLIGISTILFICDTVMELLMTSGFLRDLENLFAG